MTCKINHSGDGEIVSFSFPFFIPAKTALEVRVAGIIRAEGFNIVGAGCPEGGKVVFDAPPAAGEQVSLRYEGGVSISVDDATFGHLADKLVAGDNITLTTETQDGGIQRLRIAGTADSRVDGLVTSVGALDSRVDAVEASVETLDDRVDAVASTVTTLGTSVGALGTSLSSLNTSLNALGGRVGTVESSVDALDGRVDTVETSVNALDGRVDTVESSVTTLNTALNEAQADLVGVAYLGVAQDWTKPQRSQAELTANVGGSVALDFAQFQNFSLTLTADVTFANPTLTAAIVGQKGTIGITPAGHAITTMGSQWKRVGDVGAPSEIIGVGRIDYHIRALDRIEYAYNDVEA